MNIRRLALNMLDEYELGGKYVNLSLSSHSADNLTGEERASLTALLYTSVERKITYDYYICALSGRGISDIDPHTLNILRLGMCQILDMKSIPDFAAVNETVKLARSSGERAFVNGVLRRAVREKDSLPMPDKNKNYRRYLSVKYSYPLWIVKLLDASYGSDACEKLLEFFNSEKYTDISVNTLKISGNDLIEKLSKEGIFCEDNGLSGMSLRIPHSVNPERLCGFSEGEFFVQDRSCMISALALTPKKGECVVDVCSCPGGKSFSAAILMGDCGKVYSFDLHESKLSLVSEGKTRLGLTSVAERAIDATSPDESLFGMADKVICDVPCSGLGVLGKKPDLRYKSEDSTRELPALQLEILASSAKYLKVGGELLYSTCTLNPEENELVIEKFLSDNPEYERVDFEVANYKSQNGTLILLPHIDRSDGFFMAKIRKVR